MAVFRLAAYLGKTVGELDMTWREFIYWQAFLDEEPPERAANMRTAALMAQIANYAGKSLPKGKMVKPSDYLPRKPQTAAQQKAFFMSLTEQLNG
jgi:hypothetical protein